VKNIEEKQTLDEFKTQWKMLWRNRIDDKVRAEGIADKEYSMLFVDQGTVIMATRKFKPLDFYEILQQHKSTIDSRDMIPLNPSTGGWGKFIKTVLAPQQRTKKGRPLPTKPDKHASGQQLKKSGRGWLHTTL
jgi:hypothetical protein